MNISNELLAAYAAGNVSDEERAQVRQYLLERPSELESVMMMMDEDYDIEPESHSDKESDGITIYLNHSKHSEHTSNSISRVASCDFPNASQKSKNSFDDNIESLLSEVDF